jgi:hypothetical protein
MSKAEFGLPIKTSNEQDRIITATIFGEKLHSDLQDIFAARKFADKPKTGSLGDLNPQLVALQRQLLAQSSGGNVEQIQADSVQAYLTHRQRFAEGTVDRYGRPGFLQTVPSEHDSAAYSVLSDLESPDDDLLEEGPLYRVFKARHKTGRFDAFRSLWGRNEGEDDDTGVVSGNKIVVPLGPWAGNYVSLFVPEDRSPVLMWVYDKGGNPLRKDFRSQLQSTLTNVVYSRDINNFDVAILYAVTAVPSIIPSDQRLEATTLSVLTKLGVADPVDHRNKIFEAVEQYPKAFKPGGESYLSYLDAYQTSLIAASNPQKQAETILADPDRHSDDPGLRTFAISQMLSADNYPQFVARAYKRIGQFREELGSLADPTLDELRAHLQRHDVFRRFGRLSIPWQAAILLGEEGHTQLVKRAKEVDAKAELNIGTDFSLLHVPLAMAPEGVDDKYMDEIWMGLSFGGKENRNKKYFDMNRVLAEYQREIMDKLPNKPNIPTVTEDPFDSDVDF